MMRTLLAVMLLLMSCQVTVEQRAQRSGGGVNTQKCDCDCDKPEPCKKASP
jgi:hypothetical protein